MKAVGISTLFCLGVGAVANDCPQHAEVMDLCKGVGSFPVNSTQFDHYCQTIATFTHNYPKCDVTAFNIIAPEQMACSEQIGDDARLGLFAVEVSEMYDYAKNASLCPDR
mmetsp:Transcript_27866/g.44638  ORF Transcript_27866/g.44638 Transcript_27866/m.44638 type:complete len:110 (-) Transcript_27866:122-451(-)